MTFHSFADARVCARVLQGFKQGLNGAFVRLCKGCKTCAHLCLTRMGAHARGRACAEVTQNPCKSCNPCIINNLTQFLQPLSTRPIVQGWCKGSSKAQGLTSARRWSRRLATTGAGGVVESLEGLPALYRLSPHSQSFFSPKRVLDMGLTVAPSQAAGEPRSTSRKSNLRFLVRQARLCSPFLSPVPRGVPGAGLGMASIPANCLPS